MRRTAAIRIALCSALTVAVIAPLGCSKAQQFRMNPSPNIANLQWSKDERANRRTIVFDTNLRAASNDLDRALLIEKPSQITGLPNMPY